MTGPRVPRPAGREPARRTSSSRRSAGEGAASRSTGKTAAPALTISLLVVLVLVTGFFIYRLVRWQKSKNQPAEVVVETNNDKELAAIQKEIRDAFKLKRQAMALKDDDARYNDFQRGLRESKKAMQDILDHLDAMLDPVRDKETGELPPRYSGYNQEYQKVQTALMDMIKMGGFFDEIPESGASGG